MTCQGCVKSIQNTLLALDGVYRVEVSLEEQKAVVKYDKSMITQKTLANAIVNEAGKIAVLASGEEFIPTINPNSVCSMKITKVNVGDEIFYACGDELNCLNDAKAMYKQKKMINGKRASMTENRFIFVANVQDSYG